MYNQTKAWVLEAGQRLRESMDTDPRIEYKTSVRDLVTEKDREIESFFVSRIRHAYPDHDILGEEGIHEKGLNDPQQGWVWIIDPIDGTTNFVHQKQNFCISVALYEKGEPRLGFIYDPMAGELFHAIAGQGAFLNDQRLAPLTETKVEEAVIGINSLWLTPNKHFDFKPLQALVRDVRGTRSVGAAALEMAYVACGRLDAYLTLRLSPWDFAAGLAIVREVGAVTSTVHNQPVQVFEKSSVLVARPGLHQAIIDRYLHSPSARR
ncbi:inositol monophosphatase family protein [Caldalkalibacillus thermarum TA2.A1]|nr:inositol monophosphatase family protein [Caldalkalibacillus thermarum]QZT35441.1 inositol monophosphatase family protein [Caldalkalibacillus thermarum TA2.A1]